MNFANLFASMKKNPVTEQNTWIKCPKCLSLMYFTEIESKNNVCPKCNHHFRISAQVRIDMLSDEGSFVEHDNTLAPIDPLKFSIKKVIKRDLKRQNRKRVKHHLSSVEVVRWMVLKLSWLFLILILWVEV